MPWQEQSRMALRQEFVTLAAQDGANIQELCRRFGISRPTGYKWLRRYQQDGSAGLSDQSRRPRHMPTRTTAAIEQQVLAVRDRHPAWGGRKLRHWLLARGLTEVPSASTITAILRRHGRLDPAESVKHSAWQRFEHAAPNDLWQIDFKGHLPLEHGRCHPLTVLDDHSRFAIGLVACADERFGTVQAELTTLFRRYGLPHRILTDNGPPWGTPHPAQQLTILSIWFLRLGIAVSHGRPFHPQTQGKAERFHRTLTAEVLRQRTATDLIQSQQHFDAWRTLYNHERPHEAPDMATPASRYRVSPRPFRETLPPLEYGPDDAVRSVARSGQIRFRGQDYFVSQALRGQRVALRPTLVDGVFDVYFSQYPMGTIDLRDPEPSLVPAEPSAV